MRGHRLGVRTGLISGCLTTVRQISLSFAAAPVGSLLQLGPGFESGSLQRESANRRSLARSGSLQSTLPARAPSWSSLSALRLVHSAGIARIALLIGCVRRLPRSGCHGGAPAERQDDEERGKPFVRWAITVAPAASSNSPNEAAPTDRGGIRPALLEPARPVRTMAHHKLRHWRGPNPKGTHHDRQADRQNCCGDRRQCRHWLRYRRAPPCAPIDTKEASGSPTFDSLFKQLCGEQALVSPAGIP